MYVGLWVVILYINPERTYPNESVAVPLGVELHKLGHILTIGSRSLQEWNYTSFFLNLCFSLIYVSSSSMIKMYFFHGETAGIFSRICRIWKHEAPPFHLLLGLGASFSLLAFPSV